MQLLFVQSALHKLDANGRAAIIENGSPLFTGGVSSGESQIRRFLLENDYLEAIIALPTDLFYNTGIATYIWVLSKNKTPKRRGKIQLIDATKFSHPLRKSLGNKRNEITPEDRAAILKLYTDFTENEFSQIHPNEEFIYREYTVMRPSYDAKGKVKTDKKGNVVYDKATKDKEIVPLLTPVEEYMAKEVLPHIPDAHYELDAKKVTTGAEIPFTRYFYKYEQPRESAAVLKEVIALQGEITADFKELAR